MPAVVSQGDRSSAPYEAALRQFESVDHGLAELRRPYAAAAHDKRVGTDHGLDLVWIGAQQDHIFYLKYINQQLPRQCAGRCRAHRCAERTALVLLEGCFRWVKYN